MIFKAGNTDKSIEIELAYSTEEVFIVTPSKLRSYNLQCETFRSFLKQELSRLNPSYGDAYRLWNKNKGIYSKNSPSENHVFKLERVNRIITRDYEVIVKDENLFREDS